MKFPGRESSKITWNTKGSLWVGKKPAAPSRCLWPITAYQQLMAQRGIKGGSGGIKKRFCSGGWWAWNTGTALSDLGFGFWVLRRDRLWT